MSYESTLKSITLEAGADLSANQFYAVVMASDDGQVDVTGSDGAAILGVLQNKPSAAGQAAQVAYHGVTKMVCSGTINPGAAVKAYSDGTARAASSTNVAIGIHIGKVAAASGDVIPVLLGYPGHNALS